MKKTHIYEIQKTKVVKENKKKGKKKKEMKS